MATSAVKMGGRKRKASDDTALGVSAEGGSTLQSGKKQRTDESNAGQDISATVSESKEAEPLAVAVTKNEDDSEDECRNGHQTVARAPQSCPYLDTICRPLLDFDMAKVCSVTLSDQNVYVCLVCGKFFQGRGKSTPLFTHSVQFGHFVVMSLHTGRAYCLPEGYEIGGGGANGSGAADARSLADVQRCLRPSFTADEISRLTTKNTILARDVHGVSYLPGFVGLNNLNCTDYVSVVLHVLSHVAPVRDFFLAPSNYSESKSALVHRFGEIMRKLWSKHNFKSVVSPQEFLQEVSVSSKKRFSIGRQQECIEFMVWLLNELHKGVGGTAKPNSSVIYRAFQGEVLVHSFAKRKARPATSLEESDAPGEPAVPSAWEETHKLTPFLYLSLDIPPTPLFKDSQGGLVIPQIPLFEVLRKFDAETWTDVIQPQSASSSTSGLVRRRYEITKLPKFLILHLVRFTKNNFYVEKNPSIVTFPVKNLEMKPYVHGAAETADAAPADLDALGVHDLRVLANRNIHTISSSCSLAIESLKTRFQQCIDREGLVEIVRDSFDILEATKGLSTKYDLLANICHDSMASQGTDIGSEHKSISPTENVLTQGSYRCHVQNKATGQWFEMQDLHVTETMPQLIGLSESYLLIYERKDSSSG